MISFRNILILAALQFFLLLLAGCGGPSKQSFQESVASAGTRTTTRRAADASASNLLRLARDIESRGSVATALPLYQRAVGVDENNPDAHVALAAAYIKLGQDAEGAKAYRRALLINPNHPEALFGLGNAVLRSDSAKVEEALELLSKAAVHLNTPEVHDRLGVAYIKAKQPGKALAEFETAYRLNDKDIDIATNLALVAALMSRRDRSLAVARRAFKHPDVEAYHSRNLVLAVAIATSDAEAKDAAGDLLTPEEIERLLKLATKIRQMSDPNDRAKAIGIAHIAASS